MDLQKVISEYCVMQKDDFDQLIVFQDARRTDADTSGQPLAYPEEF